MNKLILILLFLFAFSPVHAATDIVNDGTLSTNLIACFELDEASGVRVDSTVNAYVLTDNNTVGSGTGKDGKTAADFEAGNSEYLSRTSDGAFDPGGDWSVSYWFKPETLSGVFQIIGKDSGGAGTLRAWGVDTGSTGVIGSFYKNGASFTFGSTDDSQMSNGNWSHVVITVDVSATAYIYYIDGSPVADTNAASAATNVQAGTADFAIGAKSGGGNYVDGLMQKVAVWDKVVSSGEVTSLYDSGNVLPCVAAAPPEVEGFEWGQIIMNEYNKMAYLFSKFI